MYIFEINKLNEKNKKMDRYTKIFIVCYSFDVTSDSRSS
jgi:hypothetical protein